MSDGETVTRARRRRSESSRRSARPPRASSPAALRGRGQSAVRVRRPRSGAQGKLGGSWGVPVLVGEVGAAIHRQVARATGAVFAAAVLMAAVVMSAHRSPTALRDPARTLLLGPRESFPTLAGVEDPPVFRRGRSGPVLSGRHVVRGLGHVPVEHPTSRPGGTAVRARRAVVDRGGYPAIERSGPVHARRRRD